MDVTDYRVRALRDGQEGADDGHALEHEAWRKVIELVRLLIYVQTFDLVWFRIL